jgi:poly-beta-1,6-N-acetyl-D-glucosamine synthase
MILNIVMVLMIAVYSVFIFWCRYHWNRIEDKSASEIKNSNIKVAVVVPARNESENLLALLESLSSQSYPSENIDVIISDDHSDDDTFEVAEKFFAKRNFKNGMCVRSPLTSKKNAIAFAIEKTRAELIITTDADVVVGKDWISSIVREYSDSGALLICGPVKLEGKKNYFERLQSIEFAGLIGIGAAGLTSGNPMFCNGANLAFPMKIFKEINGYENSKSASGDDTQLLLKIHKLYPGKISFLKDSRAIVRTKVSAEKSELLEQRSRWASKIPFTLSAFTISIAVIAWFVHALMLIQFSWSLVHATFLILFMSLSVKIISELVFLKSVNKFFTVKTPSWIVISAQPLYCLYIVGMGLLAPFRTFQWKGRKVR